MTAPHTPTRFLDRHLGTTGADLDTVLTRIGARSLEDLAVRVVPTTLPVLDPPQQPERPDAVVGGLSEDEAVGALRSLAALNDPHTEMIGRGYPPPVPPAVIVRDVLARLTDEQLNHLVYDKVEPDLLWIRMNGSIVGAGIGLIIFVILQIMH